MRIHSVGTSGGVNAHSALLIAMATVAFATPLAALAQSTAANAGSAPSATQPKEELTEVVVTGTLIRGTAAVGSQTITVDSEAINDKGATSTNELLGIIPQIANSFNGRIEGDPRGYQGGNISITRPNLRNLPSSNSTSGGLTLVLMDGMRLTPVGVNQASIDVDVIPAAVLESVDVVTDGGSSLYGADAVAGVINFRTRKRADGIKVEGNYGFGTTIDKFHEWDFAVTAGKSWSGGSGYISVGHSDRDIILNGQAPWASSGLVYNAAGVGSYSFTQCPSAVGTETRWFRFGPGAAQFTNNPAAPGAGTFAVGTPCDNVPSQSYSPLQKRTNVFASLSQQISDNADLRVTGYWTKRDTTLEDFPRGFTAAGSPLNTGALVGAAYPNAAVGSLTAVPGGTSFSFGVNPAYVNTPSQVGFQTWGFTPEVTLKLGGDWQLRNTLHFGHSQNFQHFAGVDAVKAQCYITGCPGIAAGQLNPLNAAAASAAVISDITNYESAQQTSQELFTLRSIADGSVFALPGGDAKLAVGFEYQDNGANSRLTSGTVGSVGDVPYMKSQRNSKSLFAELSLPLASFIDVSGSVRYDNYSDFGSTTNPNIGLTLHPTSWLKVFGHWNSSFNAPTAIDDLAIGFGRFVCGIYVPGGTPAQRPTDPLGRDTSKQGSCAMVLQGSSPGLQPQTADSWAVGFEVKPIESVIVGGEFYSIDVKDALGTLNPANASTYSTNPNQYTYNVTAAQYSALLASLTNGAALGAQQPAASNIAIIVDTRATNLNAASIEGVDFHVTYATTTGIGQLAVGLSGTVATKAFITNGGVSADQLGVGSPKLFATTFLSWNKSALSGRLTFNYLGKFQDGSLNNVGAVEDVDPFLVTNLFLGYDFKDSGGALKGTSLRLIADNLFEEEPQSIKRTNTNNVSYNNWTLGRVIKLGFTTQF
jgi:iron complex outermembrane recepter protein